MSKWIDKAKITTRLDKENELIATEKLKLEQEKEEKVKALSITFNGNLFHGCEESQNRMARNLLVMEPGNTVQWKTVTGNIVEISYSDLKAILTLAVSAVTNEVVELDTKLKEKEETIKTK